MCVRTVRSLCVYLYLFIFHFVVMGTLYSLISFGVSVLWCMLDIGIGKVSRMSMGPAFLRVVFYASALRNVAGEHDV